MQPQEDDFIRKYYTDEGWAKRTLIKNKCLAKHWKNID